MKPEARATRSRLGGEHIIVAAFLCCILIIGSACQQTNNKKELYPIAVTERLQEAYARAVNYSRMYALFVDRAEQEHKKHIAELFGVLARSEEIRAVTHANLLLGRGVQPVPPQVDQVAVGNVRQMLKMAMSSENIQYYDLYPEAIKIAVSVKDTAAMDQFLASDDLDARHRELINDAINQIDRKPYGDYSVCERCGYIFTTDREAGCPVCRKFKKSPGKV